MIGEYWVSPDGDTSISMKCTYNKNNNPNQIVDFYKGKIERKIKFEYNAIGQEIYSSYLYDSLKLKTESFKEYKDGKLFKKIVIGKQFNVSQTSVHFFDSLGLITSSIDIFGATKTIDSLKYNSNNKLIIIISYDTLNKIKNEKYYSYDLIGNTISFSNSKNNTKTKWDLNYDKHSNVTKSLKFDDGKLEEMIIRKFKYYDK
jgi:hypothetical protein